MINRKKNQNKGRPKEQYTKSMNHKVDHLRKKNRIPYQLSSSKKEKEKKRGEKKRGRGHKSEISRIRGKKKTEKKKRATDTLYIHYKPTNQKTLKKWIQFAKTESLGNRKIKINQ